MEKDRFADLVIRNEQQLYRIAKSILKNDEDCADAAQEAVAKGFANLHLLRQEQYAKTWLIKILIRECYSISRQNKKHSMMEWDDRISADSGEDTGYSELYEALSQLPEDLRIVLVLHYLEGYSVNEMAEMIDIPAGTVKSRLSRARAQLHQLMKTDF